MVLRPRRIFMRAGAELDDEQHVGAQVERRQGDVLGVGFRAIERIRAIATELGGG